MTKINFLEETEQAISNIGKTAVDEIAFIGSADGTYGCTWEEFRELADFEYDSGYGGQEIPNDLVIVFKDGTHLSRGEYDGSEWWTHNKPQQVSEFYIKIINLQELENHMSWQSVAERQITES